MACIIIPCIIMQSLFYWHAKQMVFLPPRSHLGGREWYTVVLLLYDLCIWPEPFIYLMVEVELNAILV